MSRGENKRETKSKGHPFSSLRTRVIHAHYQAYNEAIWL